MNKKALSLAICLAMALPTAVNALSLGDIESNSSLNQPFKGRIQLLSTSVAEAKTLRIRVAPAAVFNRVGIDRPAFLNSIKFRTTIQNGRPIILVSSSQPINEPFLNFLLEVSWPNGQLLKEYTVLLDPPVLIRPDTAIASNTAGVRAEPRAQGRITRPAAQQRRVVQQPRRVVRAATPPRRAPARRAAPTRRVAAAPQARNYRVRSGDTLSKVAKKLGYRGIKSEQMMIALFEKNRIAFSKSNINNLKAGAVLKRPSLQEAKAIGSKKAKSQIIAQAREWKKARAEKIAQNANNKKAGTVKAPQQARLEVVGNSDSVKGDSSQGSSAATAELNKKLTLANESLTTRLKENEELKSRVTELESLLRKKNRLITLKSQQLAQLQGSMSGETPETSGENTNVITEPVEAVVSTPEVTEEPVVVDEGGDIQQQVANNLANEQGQIIREEQVDTTGIPESLVEEPVIADTEAVESPFKEKEASFDIMGLLGSPAAMGIGGGSLLALLGGLWFMRRRNSKGDNDYEEFSSIDVDNGMDETAFDESSFVSEINETDFVKHEEIQQEAKMTEDESQLVDEGEQEDILQEADVYIVYGLHDQAESELKQAIVKDPQNLAYRAKLIENYKAAGDKDSFEEEVKEFMTIESEGKEAYLEDITEWGNSLLPDNKLFSGDSLVAGAAAATATGVAMVAGKALATEDKVDTRDVEEFIDIDIDLPKAKEVTDDFMLDDDLENFNLDDVLSESDDELDLGKAVEKDDLSSDFEQDADAIKVDLTEDFNIDIDEEFLETASSNMEDESNESVLEETAEEDFAVNLEDITNREESIDLDSSLEVANLNLDLDSEELSKIMPKDNAYTKATDENDAEDSFLAEFDFDDAEADLEETVLAKLDDEKLDIEDNLLAEFDDNLSFLDLDDEDEVIEETQIETRLDLAKAYIDMGDIEGARSTLEEVMQDGSDKQKRQAEKLLHQTG